MLGRRLQLRVGTALAFLLEQVDRLLVRLQADLTRGSLEFFSAILLAAISVASACDASCTNCWSAGESFVPATGASLAGASLACACTAPTDARPNPSATVMTCREY